MKKTNATLDLVISEYANGTLRIYPLAPNYEAALRECRLALDTGSYAQFLFLRIRFPEKTVEALNCLVPGLEGGPSDVPLDLDYYSQEFQNIVMELAENKGIATRQANRKALGR